MTARERALLAELALVTGWAKDAETGCKASAYDSARWVCEALGVPENEELGDVFYELGEAGVDLHEQAWFAAGFLS